ncbi:hypothetical protein ASPFODRAFT_54656, partial [Aspergillus luchuensis CBS 106.47]
MSSHLYAVLGTSTCQSISTRHDARKLRSARAMPRFLPALVQYRASSVHARCRS